MDQVDDAAAAEGVADGEDEHQCWANKTLKEEHPTGQIRGAQDDIVVETNMDCDSLHRHL